MEIKIIEEKKNKAIIELSDMGHTFCNVLKKELWNDQSVKTATYSIMHPLVSKPRMIVETDSSKTPKQAMQDAIKRLKKTSEKFRTEFLKEVKS